MERSPVISSNIKTVGYDPETQVLEIEFDGGGVYQYKDVPPEKHLELVQATSVGSYFYHNIRNDFETTKIE